MAYLDHVWACPYCGDPIYYTRLIITDYSRGSWTCPECGCRTSFPDADALLEMWDTFGLYMSDNKDEVTVYHFPTNGELEKFASNLDPDFESFKQIPAAMASVLINEHGLDEIEWRS